HAAGLATVDGAVLAYDDGLEVGRVRHHREDDLAADGALPGRGGARGAGGRQRLLALARAVVDRDVVPRRQQAPGHGRPHRAETYETYAHAASLRRRAPPARSPRAGP